MNRLSLTMLTMMLAFGVSAQEEETPTYLCISDAQIGFSWENGQWVQKRFVEEKYLIKKDFEWMGEATNLTWAVYRFGRKSPSYWCPKEFYSVDELHCDGGKFQFSMKTLRYGHATMFSVLNPEDEPTDAMTIEHGKCSLL